MLFWQVLFWSRTPLDGYIEPRRHLAKVFERPAFFQITRKGMNHGDVFGRLRGYGDARDAFGRRECGKKREWQVADRVAEFGTVRSIPGIDGLEGFQLRNAGAFHYSHQI